MLTRKRLLAASAGAAAAAAVLRFPAGAAEFTYKFATEQPADHHMTLRLTAACDKIKADTNGRLEITMFNNSSLGSQTDMVSQVRLNAVQFITSFDSVMGNVVPVAGITTLPFIFNGPKDALATMAGPLGKYRRAQLDKIGIFAFDLTWNEGFRQMVNQQRPITMPDDMKGMKIRIPASPIVTALFKALGTIPTAVSSNEMYVALQTHLVDGIELPLGAIEAYKIYEVNKYVSYTNHIWTAFTMVANKDAYMKLPKNIQDIVAKNINAAGEADNADTVRLEVTLENQLKTQGLTFNHADIPAFRNVVKKAGLYSQWEALYGPEAWALLEKAVGKLT